MRTIEANIQLIIETDIEEPTVDGTPADLVVARTVYGLLRANGANSGFYLRVKRADIEWDGYGGVFDVSDL